MADEKIRESVIAGSWYTDQPDQLRAELERYLARASSAPSGGNLVGLIVPHAGYYYSGGVAAHAYKLLKDRPRQRVLILAPSHRAAFHGASVYDLGGFRTPLGVVPLDRELVGALRAHAPLFGYVPGAEAQEHSLEIQIPFLQVVVGAFCMTPVIMGDQSVKTCRELAAVIAEECRGRDVLIVASTDLSHYHPYDEAVRLDRTVLERVGAFDPEGLLEAHADGKCEACGLGPMLTLMFAARELGADRATVLHYANSGDVSGDRSGVVGYMAAAFYGKEEDGSNKEGTRKVGVDLGLSPEEKETLREIAYQAIRSRCLGEPMPDIPASTPKLNELRGAFVCLHKGGELRGCIGMIEARKPLHVTIREMAVQAAFSDPRFCALDRGELAQIDLELSVLTPLERIADPSRIEIGRHGLLVRRGYHSGLLLPQVAEEHGWGRREFLEWTCRKAGLSLDAWKDSETEIYVFSADVF